MPNTCQEIADLMEQKLIESDNPPGHGADCDDIRNDYEAVFGEDDELVKAYDEAAGRTI